MSDQNDKILLKAKILEKSEDHLKSCELIEAFIVNKKNELNIDERNTFSICFENLIKEKIEQWRKLGHIIDKEQIKEPENELIFNDINLKNKIELEIKEICKRVIRIIDEYLFKNCKLIESKIAYLKMKGDFYRIMTYVK